MEFDEDIRIAIECKLAIIASLISVILTPTMIAYGLTVQERIPVSAPIDVAVNSDTNKVHVTNSEANMLSVIDGFTNEVVGSVTLDFHPSQIDVNEETNMIYVAGISNSFGSFESHVAVIDGSSHCHVYTLFIK